MLDRSSHVGGKRPCWREAAMLEGSDHVGGKSGYVGEKWPCWKKVAMLSRSDHVE